jgi:4-diphosphocytidyl-2-C-methyl-D-erythritol kinase
MRIPAAAKINLHLRVAPTGADGFHPLLTWMVTIGLFDTLILVRRNTGDSEPDTIFTLRTDHPDLPTDERNLVTRAARALREAVGAGGLGRDREGPTGAPRDSAPDAKVHLDPVSAFLCKRIPHGAGLGGGSSDAASALLGLNAIWRANLSAARLSDIAAHLGSDVPFFLHGSSSICTGRGEIVRPIARPDICRWAVLVLPEIQMPTPAVYRQFDLMRLGREQDIKNEPDWNAMAKLPAAELLPQLVNDLEAPAFSLKPELEGLRSSLQQKLGRIVRMSGSGSSLFTLCDQATEAESLARQAREITSARVVAVKIAPEGNHACTGVGAT